MKRWFNGETGEEIYVGTAQEIRALYGSLVRAMKAQHTCYEPLYADAPCFKAGRQYELTITEGGLFSVSRSEVKEPVDKKTLAHFIRRGVIERCGELREEGYNYISILSDRCVAINGVVDFPVKAFLNALKNSYVMEFSKDLCLHMEGGGRVWIKSTDNIHVL